MKDVKSLLFYYSMVLTIYAVYYIIRIIYPASRHNDLIYHLAGICVITFFLFGYLFYSWKSNIAEFLKRIRLAAPFALMFLVLIAIVGHGNIRNISSGLLICILLLLKTPNWKQHFSVILIPASIIVILARFLLIPLMDFDNSSEGVLLRVAFSFACFISIFNFYSLYISKVIEDDIPDLKAILVKSIKFSITLSLFLAAVLALLVIGDKQGISLPMQILANSLLAISFLVISYKFDLSLIERKKSKKENRISELHDELNDFYQEELKRTKRKI